VSLPSGTPAKFWLEPKFSRVLLQAPTAGVADAWVLVRDAKTQTLRADHYLLRAGGAAAPKAGAPPIACPVFAEFAGDASSVVGPPPTDPLRCTVRWKGGVPELVVDVGGQCVLHVPHVARIAI
jgi:hypothetical protein